MSQKKSGKKTITFSHKKHIKKVPHLNNLSDDIIEDCWYSPGEYEDIKASFQHVVFMMDSGESANIESEQQTPRGLEYRTQEGAWDRFEHKRDAYNAVLDEQDRQWNRNLDDPEKIAKLYLEVSASCQRIAEQQGKEDEMAIEDYMRDARRHLKDFTKADKHKKRIGPGDIRLPKNRNDDREVITTQEDNDIKHTRVERCAREVITTQEDNDIKDTRVDRCGQPKIFIRYTEALGNKTAVRLSLNTCSIMGKDGKPVAREIVGPDYSTTSCGLEEILGTPDLTDYQENKAKPLCLALCIDTVLKSPNNRESPRTAKEIGYVLLVSNKKLMKPNTMRLRECEQHERDQTIACESTDKYTTLQHINFILNEICRDKCTILETVLKENGCVATKNSCHLNLENHRISDDRCSAISFALHGHSFLTHLNVRLNQLGASICTSLANLLKKNLSTRLSYLDIGYNDIGTKGCISLFQGLDSNASIRELNLQCNGIGADACKAIGNTLLNENKKSSLVHLNLGENKIENSGCIILFDALKMNRSPLMELNLEANGIGPWSCEACKVIGNALEDNNSLQRLSLGKNRIGNQGCIHIADGLDINGTLQTLCLKQNDIGDDGCEAILSAIQSNPDCALSHVNLSSNPRVSENQMAYFQHQLAGRNNT